MAHWPSSAGPAAHFALAVQRAVPSGSPLTQTLGLANCQHTNAHMTTPPLPRLRTSPQSLTLALALLLAGCGTMGENGISSLVGSAPGIQRAVQTNPNTYYVEVLGNNFSSWEKLQPFFEKKAEELCGGKPEASRPRNGNRFPHGKLPEIRIQSCIDGGFCNRTQASFPLVYGEVVCQAARPPA
jgi:hypothetical protein